MLPAMRCGLLLAAATLACSHQSWQELRPVDGRFRVELPGTAVERIQKTITLPTTTDSHVFLVERGARGSFQVAYYELTLELDPATWERTAKLDCTSPYAGGTFEITAQQPRRLGTAVGFDVTGEAPKSETLPDGGFEEDRCFIAARRMFHVMAIGPNTADERRDVARFMDSFQIL